MTAAAAAAAEEHKLWAQAAAEHAQHAERERMARLAQDLENKRRRQRDGSGGGADDRIPGGREADTTVLKQQLDDRLRVLESEKQQVGGCAPLLLLL
jgi:hypothetical protein